MLDLKQYATIHQDHPFKPDITDEYLFIPTIQVVKDVAEQGWFPTRVMEKTTKHPIKEGYQKHIVVFRNDDKYDPKEKEVPELLLTNSHDGSCSFRLQMGIFRMICANGLVICKNQSFSHHIIHKEYNAGFILYAIKEIDKATPYIFDKMKDYKDKKMTISDCDLYAQMACGIRWGDKIPFKDMHAVLFCRREEDYDKTLWNIFNRIQENIVSPLWCNGRRPIFKRMQSMDKINILNQDLWALTEEFYQLSHKVGK